MPLPLSVRRFVCSLLRPAPKGRPAPRRLHLGALEERVVPALVPVGDEFRVNTITADTQREQVVAMDADGDFVVVWSSYVDGVLKEEVRGQRYNAAGLPQGSEFPVNIYTNSYQSQPAVGMDANGDFVVAWRTFDQDGDDGGIFARRFNAAGEPLTGEFQVNTYTTNGQYLPAVAMNAAGQFVIAWESVDQDGDASGIYAQLFGADGVPAGAEIAVNQTTEFSQDYAHVAMDAAGNFVVSWDGETQMRDYDVFARRYNAAGQPLGDEFRPNTTTADNQAGSEVAMDTDGNFIVTWGTYGQGISDGGAYARRYNAAGVPQGIEFRVNTFMAGGEAPGGAAMHPDGRFVITLISSDQDVSDLGVYAQEYRPDGAPLGAVFRVNTFTQDQQWFPDVAVSADGDAVIAWTSVGQDGSFDGVYAQRYKENVPPVLSGVPAAGTVDELSTFAFTATATDSDDDPATLRFSLVGAPAGAAIDPVTGAFSWTPTEAQGPNAYAFFVRVSDAVNWTDVPITLTVREVNAAPVLTVPATATAVPGATLTFSATATDPDLVNGQPNTFTFNLVGAPAGAAIDPVTGDFTWTPAPDVALGDYPFQVRVADGGTPLGTDTKPITVTVVRTGIVSGNLAMAGTPGNDVITVLPAADLTKLAVKINGLAAGEFPLAAISGRVIAHGFDGNDKITVGSTVAVGADLWGGFGNDTVTGGAGPDVLRGETGNDRLVGGRGNDRYSFADLWGVDTLIETSTGGTDTVDLSAATEALTFMVAASVRATAGTNRAAGAYLENILGGSADDTFKFAAGGKVRGAIDGGLGVNSLNYTAYLSPVSVNLALGTATGTA
ncbi:MAG TPA: putative Ig domain-containing protein, partial [Gemmataceae bacterium]|nr:putative Ig domain-containing protein [Gemmataceae bacterium]